VAPRRQFCGNFSFRFRHKSSNSTQIKEKLKDLSAKAKLLSGLSKRPKGKEEKVETISKPEEEPAPLETKSLPEEPAQPDKMKGNGYKSVLECLEGASKTQTDGVLCPFEIGGDCSDKECKYLHLARNC